jgi:hypothetical protein
MTVQDESALIWYSGSEEKRLWLNAVSRIVPGQRTVSTFCSLFLSTVVKFMLKKSLPSLSCCFFKDYPRLLNDY